MLDKSQGGRCRRILGRIVILPLTAQLDRRGVSRRRRLGGNSGQRASESITTGRNCRNGVMSGDLRRLPSLPCVHKRCRRISKLGLAGIDCCLLSSGRNHVLTSAARFMEELTSVGLGCLKKIMSDQRVRCFDPPTKTVASSISTDVS